VRQLAGQGAGTLARVAAQAAAVCCCMPLLERPGEAMAAAVRILEELLITNAAQVGTAFARMPPLPSVPAALAGVNVAPQRLDGPPVGAAGAAGARHAPREPQRPGLGLCNMALMAHHHGMGFNSSVSI
jgi:hypothetical protein